MEVSGARLLRLPAGGLGWLRACCSWVPKARVESRSCCADGLEGSPGCEQLCESRGGWVSSRNGPAFPSVCFLRAELPCCRPQRLLAGARRVKVPVCFLVWKDSFGFLALGVMSALSGLFMKEPCQAEVYLPFLI